MKDIVLASSSPRREEILRKFGINPIIIEPKIEETIRKDEKSFEIVMGLSFEKAYSVSKKVKDNKIIIASDTVVVLEEEIIGKPKSKEEAFTILKKLNGREHSVITGLAVIESNTDKKIIDYEETLVEFKNSSDERLKKYIDTLEPMDKAGAYGIQGLGQLLVKSINGSYLNVVGFPIEKLDDILREDFNIRIL